MRKSHTERKRTFDAVKTLAEGKYVPGYGGGGDDSIMPRVTGGTEIANE